MAAPPPASIVNKAARQACWATRDAYVECATAHGPVPEAGKPTLVPRECARARAAFEAACPKSWVRERERERERERAKGGGDRTTPIRQHT